MRSHWQQKTIKKEGSISGIGLHSGVRTNVSFKPAPVGFGIRFFKNNRPVEGFVESQRCTAIGDNGLEILTVEHLMAAMQGVGITNLRVEVDGPEIPGLDGSAILFVRLFKKLGVTNQAAAKDIYKITEPIFCGEPNRAISIVPASEFRVSYALDYSHAALKAQMVDFVMTEKNFEKEIAPARTFCTKEEADALKKQGFGKGANTRNTLVISEKGLVRNRFRFSTECARHKVLDILGDMALLGFSVIGRVAAIRSGHALNRQLVGKIKNQREAL